MNKLKKGDEVIVITGKDKGHRGHIVSFKNNDRVLVSGINKAIKHVKPNPQKGIQGGKIEIDMPIHISNIKLFNPKIQEGDKVGVRILDAGKGKSKRVRFFKSTNELV